MNNARNASAIGFSRALKRLLLVGGVAVVLLTGFLWWILLSPFGYHEPEGYPAIEEDRAHRVFAYGTLRWKPVRRIVVGRSAEPRPAQLLGYRKESLNLVPDEESAVKGIVFEVTSEELRRLDRYERAGLRYDRLEQQLMDGSTAWVYRRIE